MYKNNIYSGAQYFSKVVKRQCPVRPVIYVLNNTFLLILCIYITGFIMMVIILKRSLHRISTTACENHQKMPSSARYLLGILMEVIQTMGRNATALYFLKSYVVKKSYFILAYLFVTKVLVPKSSILKR